MNTNVGLLVSALLVSSFPPEVFQLVAWVWVASVFFLLGILIAAAVARSFILPYTHPDLHRLVTSCKKPTAPTDGLIPETRVRR